MGKHGGSGPGGGDSITGDGCWVGLVVLLVIAGAVLLIVGKAYEAIGR